MFKPVTKWADMLLTPDSVPEMVRKAFDLAQQERPGATYIAIPEDVEAALVPKDAKPLTARSYHAAGPDEDKVAEAVDTAAEKVKEMTPDQVDGMVDKAAQAAKDAISGQ